MSSSSLIHFYQIQCVKNHLTSSQVQLHKTKAFFSHFSSRETIFSTISRLTQRTVKIQKNSSKKYAQDKVWIEKNLREGKWEQIRDISKKSSPVKDAETPAMSFLSPKRPAENPSADELGRGRRMKFSNPKYR